MTPAAFRRLKSEELAKAQELRTSYLAFPGLNGSSNCRDEVVPSGFAEAVSQSCRNSPTSNISNRTASFEVGFTDIPSVLPVKYLECRSVTQTKRHDSLLRLNAVPSQGANQQLADIAI